MIEVSQLRYSYGHSPKFFVDKDSLALSRSVAATLITFIAINEINYANETDGGIPQGCGAQGTRSNARRLKGGV